MTSSGLLSSGLGSSFTHQMELKAPEPVALTHQVFIIIGRQLHHACSVLCRPSASSSVILHATMEWLQKKRHSRSTYD